MKKEVLFSRQMVGIKLVGVGREEIAEKTDGFSVREECGHILVYALVASTETCLQR